MERTVERLRAATAEHDALARRVLPDGTVRGSELSEVVDQVRHDLNDARSSFRVIEDEAIDALCELYEPYEDLDKVREAIDSAQARWVEHAIFNRAAETTARKDEDR